MENNKVNKNKKRKSNINNYSIKNEKRNENIIKK